MKKILFLLILLTSCTGIEDGIKDLESDTFGLKREAVVYSYTGQKIATYSGNSVREEMKINVKRIAEVGSETEEIKAN